MGRGTRGAHCLLFFALSPSSSLGSLGLWPSSLASPLLQDSSPHPCFFRLSTLPMPFWLKICLVSLSVPCLGWPLALLQPPPSASPKPLQQHGVGPRLRRPAPPRRATATSSLTPRRRAASTRLAHSCSTPPRHQHLRQPSTARPRRPRHHRDSLTRLRARPPGTQRAHRPQCRSQPTSRPSRARRLRQSAALRPLGPHRVHRQRPRRINVAAAPQLLPRPRLRRR